LPQTNSDGPGLLTVSQLDPSHSLTMPPQKGENPFGLSAAKSSTSQISPSPARNSAKSQGGDG